MSKQEFEAPTIGRVVVYVLAGNELAAIVAAVHSPTIVTLCVLDQNGNTSGAGYIEHEDAECIAEDGRPVPASERPAWRWPSYRRAKAAD